MRCAQEGTLKPRSVALTFDDGYRDNFRFAFPILKKYEVPATLFLATGCTEGGEPLWYDRVFYVFKATQLKKLDLSDWGLSHLPLETIPQRQQAMYTLANHFRTISDDLRLARQSELNTLLGVTDFRALNGLMLSWDEVRELNSNGFEVEGHTVTHPILSRVTPEVLKEQIEGCKSTLEDKLQKSITLFAYPNGRPEDYNLNVIERLKASGFQHAFTTVFGLNRQGDSPFEQRRAAPWHENVAGFAFDQLKIQAGR
jgi:peptidoglycan/xylan/chitin deacetylase (PgdA/CDA1 family)